MATIDDKATEAEERDRALALSVRRQEGPEPCGVCYSCNTPVKGLARWCDDECRDDWQFREDMRRRSGG